MEIITILSVVFFTQFILVFISIGVGRFLIDKALNMDLEPVQLRIGACFFVGVAYIVVLIRTCTYLTNDAKLTVYSVILGSFLLASFRYAKMKLDFITILGQGKVAPIFIFIFSISTVLLFVWLPPQELNERDFLSSIGSLHSVRYAWVANFIYEKNNIPVIPQNTAQSILAFIGGEFSFPAPFLYLFLWLISSIFFLSLFIYGILYKLTDERDGSLLGTAIFMLGNTAFSVTHVLTIDSGSPFLANGYSDTISGVFSLLFFFLLNNQLNERKNCYRYLFLISCLMVSFNFYCAPQNVLFIPLLLLCLYFPVARLSNFRMKNIIFWLLVIIFSSILSLPQGGMLTPSTLLSDISYPGIMSPSGNGLNKGLSFIPGVPFHTGWLGHWLNGWSSNLTFAKEFILTGQGKFNFFNQIIWNLEQIFFTSLRIHFFPILGILFLLIKFNKSYGNNNSECGTLLPNQVGLCGGILFLSSFVLCFFFSLNGYKWELSRFLIPGVSIGMLGLALAAAHLTTKIVFGRIYSFAFIGVFILGGPALNILGTGAQNAIKLISKDLLTSYFLELIGSGPIVN